MRLDSIRSLAVACSVSLVLAASAPAETVRLADGRMLAGEVRLEGERVVVDATFPKVDSYVLRREEIAPESLFEILERRADPGDVEQRRELARFAERHGLEALAIAEHRRVQRLDPASRPELEQRIARLFERIARELLDEARGRIEAGDREAALTYLHAIVEDHPETRAATDAKRALRDLQRTVAEASAVAIRTVPEDEAPEVLERAVGELEKGDEALRGIRGFASSVRDQRAVERAIRHYERAWEAARTLPVSADAPELRTRVAEVRDRAKSELVDAYVAAATVHVQRRSLNSAERYVDKAYVLDPDHGPTHDLHRLILRAKIFDGSGALFD